MQSYYCKKTIKQMLITLLMLSLAVLLLEGGCGSGGSNSSSSGSSGSEDIFMKDPDSQFVMALEDIKTVSNQALVMFEQDVTHAEALSIMEDMENDLEDHGLRLVGQIPSLGLYQVELGDQYTEAESALDALNEVMDSMDGYSGVEVTFYNYIPKMYQIEADDDNGEIQGENRAAFSVIDYYQAIPIFDRVMDSLSLQDVKVAVVDSGLDTSMDQFEDTNVTALPGSRLMGNARRDYHGTAVSSIIAADHDDGMTNGIASRVLGDHLHLQIGRCVAISDNYANVVRAVRQGARVVNMSWGGHANSRRPEWLQGSQEAFENLFSNYQDTLFVAAAANTRFELNGTDCPAGLPGDNLITVGGLNSTNPWDEVFDSSSFGPGIDIGAPATNVPVSRPGGIHYWDGNSFAAAIVSSMAAIIFSLDPDMSGADMKELLTTSPHVLIAPLEVGGRRPALIQTVGSAMLEKASSEEVDYVLNYEPCEQDDHINPVHMICNELAGTLSGSIEGRLISTSFAIGGNEQMFQCDERLQVGNNAMLRSGSITIDLLYEDAKIDIEVSDDFRIGETYELGAGNGGLDIWENTENFFDGDLESGSITFTEAELTNRSHALTSFFQSGMQLTGELQDAVFRGPLVIGGESTEDATHEVNLEFSIPVHFQLIGDENADYLEENAIGGYNYEP